MNHKITLRHDIFNVEFEATSAAEALKILHDYGVAMTPVAPAPTATATATEAQEEKQALEKVADSIGQAPAPAPAFEHPKASKSPKPSPSAAPAAEPSPAPTPAPAPGVDYKVLQAAVFKLAELCRQRNLQSSTITDIAKAHGGATFKTVPQDKWGPALKDVQAKIDEIDSEVA